MTTTTRPSMPERLEAASPALAEDQVVHAIDSPEDALESVIDIAHRAYRDVAPMIRLLRDRLGVPAGETDLPYGAPETRAEKIATAAVSSALAHIRTAAERLDRLVSMAEHIRSMIDQARASEISDNLFGPRAAALLADEARDAIWSAGRALAWPSVTGKAGDYDIYPTIAVTSTVDDDQPDRTI